MRLRWGAAYRLEGLNLLVSAEYESQIRTAELRRRSVELVGNAPREVFESGKLRLHDSRVNLGQSWNCQLRLPCGAASAG